MTFRIYVTRVAIDIINRAAFRLRGSLTPDVLGSTVDRVELLEQRLTHLERALRMAGGSP